MLKKHPVFKQELVTVPTFPYDLVPLVEGGGAESVCLREGFKTVYFYIYSIVF